MKEVTEVAEVTKVTEVIGGSERFSQPLKN